MELRITDMRAQSVQANFEWTFIKIYAGDLYGVGEAGHAPGLIGMLPSFKKLLIGEDALKIRKIEQKLRWATHYSGTTTYHMISAINIALYDLVGKYLNIPIWKLIGGYRDRVRVYVDAHGGKGLEAMNSLAMPVKPAWLNDTRIEKDRVVSMGNPIHGRLSIEKWNEDYSPSAYATRAKEMIEEGFTAIKFDLDVPTPYTDPTLIMSGELSLKDVDYLASLVRAAREAAGDGVDLMFDLHWRYNINTAARICKAIEPYRPRWIEDPVPAQMTISNLDEYRLLTQLCQVPIETGENMYTVYQFKDLLGTGVRVWAPDLAKAGGIGEGIRIADLASMYDIELSPHNIGSPIATMAHAHMASMANTFGVLEFHGHDVPFWNNIIKPRKPLISKGFIELSDEPGLGIDLDIDEMRKIWPEFEL